VLACLGRRRLDSLEILLAIAVEQRGMGEFGEETFLVGFPTATSGYLTHGQSGHADP
jgi:hypothetical protein